MLYVMSASYDSTMNAVVLKLYNDETEKVETWIDVDFKPYFLSKTQKINARKITVRKKTLIQKYDAIKNENIPMWKCIVDTPRMVKKTHYIEEEMEDSPFYENHIKFFQSNIYDKDIKMGMPYLRENEKLVFQTDQSAHERIHKILSKFELDTEERATFEKWAMLLEYPAPDFKRASLDIEVYNENKTQIPNSEKALLPILAVCIASNRGEKLAYILTQENKKLGKLPDNINKVVVFTDEKKLIEAVFSKMAEYPIVLTFNGDDFDFKYLYYRAMRFDIPKEKIPIIVYQRVCMLKSSFHIDLYKFFSIKAMKIYAFKAKYKNVDLDSVCKALIKKGKIKGNEKWVTDMNYHDLIKYCMNDAEITLELTTYDNNLVMNLILVLERISRMPIENVSRKSVSSWIRSFMIYEHRQRNILIPNPNDLKTLKGTIASKAMIKGKKYKGAIVFEPIVGTHFSVLVLDFASLYPSIFKVYNIGYSTINCSHEECKSNTIGELPHWICTKQKSLESLLIGSLRDLRVSWYKKKAKDKSLDKKFKNWYSVTEQAIKVILNASYGVFGAESFLFYCPPVAEEITAIARHIISETAKHAEKTMEVLYGDTDSIFVKKPPKNILEELIEWTQKEYGIEFEVDTEYRYICLSKRKKNYLGIKKDGTVDVKGLTGKKKHTPYIIRDAFNDTKKILSKIKTNDQITNGKKEIIALLKKIYFTFKHRNWKDINDLAFHVTMNSALEDYKKTTPQHVKAAKLLIEKGYQIDAGSIINFIKTNEKLAKGYTVKPVEMTGNEEVDIKKYIEFLKSTFEQILEPLDISFDEDIVGITKMDSWM